MGRPRALIIGAGTVAQSYAVPLAKGGCDAIDDQIAAGHELGLPVDALRALRDAMDAA